MFQDDGGIHTALSTVIAYAKQIEHKNEFFELEKRTDTKNTRSRLKTPLVTLEYELKELGYRFCVYSDGEQIFSNIVNSTELDQLKERTKDMENSIITTQSISFIKQQINDYTFYVLNDYIRTPPQRTFIDKYIFDFIVYFAITIIIIIIVVSSILSKNNEKMLLDPLTKIKYGTEEIAKGNLDFLIDYTNNDEFLEVCNSFNNMREQLQASIRQKLLFEEYRKTLVADISHDFRTPLTNIKGYTEGLIDGIAKTEEKKIFYYNAIKESTQDIEFLINNLSELSILDDINEKYTLEAVNINNYLQNFIQKRYEEFNAKKISTIFDTKVDSIVSINTHDFNRLLLNIIENSYKYANKDTIIISFTTKKIDNSTIITVTDNGQGVKNKNLHKIFNRFYREDESRTNTKQGHGIGLSIVKQIVIKHNGTITAENDNGLKITITLPSYGEINE